MKHLYLLIEADSVISMDSKFYFVQVGDSQQEQRFKRFLIEAAQKNNWFFSRYDNGTTLYLQRVAGSLGQLVCTLGLQSFSSAQLVRYLKQHHKLPAKPILSASQGDALARCNPNYWFKRKISVLRNAEATERKKPKAIDNRLPV